MDLMFFLLLGHFYGDYALQTDSIANNKKHSIRHLSIHSAIYVISIWVAIGAYSLAYKSSLFLSRGNLVFLGILLVQHWLQDFYKSRWGNRSKQFYYIDQALHITVLYLYRIFLTG